MTQQGPPEKRRRLAEDGSSSDATRNVISSRLNSVTRSCDDNDDEEDELDEESIPSIELYRYRDFYNPVQKNEPLYKFLDDESNFLGNLVLYHFCKNNEVLRKLLVRLVIEREMSLTRKSRNPFSLRRKEFKAMAKSIIKIFASEEIDYYYEASFILLATGPNTKKKVNAKGALINGYESYRGIVKETGLLKKKVLVSNSSDLPDSLATTGLNELDISIPSQTDLVPENEILAEKTWKEVFDYRHETAFPLKTAFQIMNEFKILKTPMGPSLIRSDFERLYGPDVAGRFESQKSTVAQQIITMVFKDLNISVTNGSAEGLQDVFRFQAIDFSKQRDILQHNNIIFNESV